MSEAKGSSKERRPEPGRLAMQQGYFVEIASIVRIFAQDVAHTTKATAFRRNQRPRASFSLAGFEVTLIGRFWVTPEASGAAVSIGFASAASRSNAGLPEEYFVSPSRTGP
jgi:hypothetical protein